MDKKIKMNAAQERALMLSEEISQIEQNTNAISSFVEKLSDKLFSSKNQLSIDELKKQKENAVDFYRWYKNLAPDLDDMIFGNNADFLERHRDKRKAKLESLKEFIETIEYRISKRKENDDNTELPFKEEVLFEIWKKHKYDGIWKNENENEKFEPFLQAFKGKGGIEILKNQQNRFCKLLGEIEEIRDRKIAPNMANWVKKTFRIPVDSYKSQKIIRK